LAAPHHETGCPMTKRWLITGCSTGFGKVLAAAVLERGDSVVLTARNPETLSALADKFPKTARAAALDVTKAGDAAKGVAVAEEAFGGLDILVNNAGFGFIGAIEEATPEEYRPMFETNIIGLLETTRAALPALRKAGGGRIVNMSSGAGIKGLQGSGHYNATKFAVEGISEALAQEVAPFGISVIIVEPGPFRTEFLGRSISAAKREMPEYAKTAGMFRSYKADNDGSQAGDPAKAVKVMLKAIDSAQPPLHLPLGPRAFALARAKIAEFTRDVDAWEKEAIATDFDA
jgi:NAD(P)-dependent dehydrogenase (short-subunit alcohol dehydrogenase family)